MAEVAKLAVEVDAGGARAGVAAVNRALDSMANKAKRTLDGMKTATRKLKDTLFSVKGAVIGLGGDFAAKQLGPHAKDTALFLQLFGREAGPGITALAGMGNGVRETTTAFDGLGNVAANVGRTISTAFADAVRGGESFRDVLRGLAEDLSRIGMKAFMTGPLEKFVTGAFGGGGGLLGGLFSGGGGGLPSFAMPATAAGAAELLSGALQRGGPVSAGDAFLVGEAGPELFVPRQSGAVVANEAQGGDVHIGAINLNVAGGINDRGRKTPQQVGAQIAREIARASRRNN
jgi:phage-related minor tail protein